MDVVEPLDVLRTSVRRLTWLTVALAVLVVGLSVAVITLSMAPRGALTVDEVRARRIVVLDDQGVMRVEMGQDSHDAGRRSRTAGVWLYDAKGDERGGMATHDDGVVGLAFDAPMGKGEDHLRDRLSLRVDADGAAQVLLTDNLTRGIVGLLSDGAGNGGVETYRWDMEAKLIHRRYITFDQDERQERPLGEPQMQ
ncbi:hypothetical protein [Stenotrophomonas rhizophila]